MLFIFPLSCDIHLVQIFNSPLHHLLLSRSILQSPYILGEVHIWYINSSRAWRFILDEAAGSRPEFLTKKLSCFTHFSFLFLLPAKNEVIRTQNAVHVQAKLCKTRCLHLQNIFLKNMHTAPYIVNNQQGFFTSKNT
jgi:hypothetical protein